MSECTHDCSSCGKKDCDKKSFIVNPKPTTEIKKMIAVVSGKGGVGKSYISSLLSVAAQKKGYKTGCMDVDITGPSIPKAFGFTNEDKALGNDEGLLPNISKTGVKIMSINLLLEDITSPVVWRGPVLSGVVQQFYTDVLWEKLDMMFIDMPPGTGDIPLTVFQSLPISGIIVVTTPQDLVKTVVEKAINMANMMNIPILGLVENMSYVECPKCKEKIYLFGESHIDELSEEYGLDVLARLPIKQENRQLVDEGRIEDVSTEDVDKIIDLIMEK